ncbi:MAG: hypothetical protein OEV00_06330 [Acidobacteriota bacterium]|nr:hypothetical protein [Acidobacteriota bacterium]MDH3784927.1 hypothetical protein [Acidobacteriota bacterium]
MKIEACSKILPLVSRVIEGEATPIEAMRVAHHDADCTHCKIVHARERRLAVLLEQGLPELSIGDDVVASVMAGLPDGPPPAEKRRRRRGLRLATVLGGLMGGTWLWSSTQLPAGIARTYPAMPSPEYETALPILDQIVSLAGMAWIALVSAGNALAPLTASAQWPTLILAISVGVAAGLALLSTSICGFLAYGVGGLLRQDDRD